MGKANIIRNLKQSKPQMLLKDLDTGAFFATTVDYITHLDNYRVYIKLTDDPITAKTKVIDISTDDIARVIVNLDRFAGVVELKADIAVEEV